MSKPTPDSVLAAIANNEPITLEDILATGAALDAYGATNPGTALVCAAYAGRVDLIRQLVARGAVVDRADAQGITPLLEAATSGHEAAVSALLELGADVEAETVAGTTPLMAAAAWGHVGVVRILLAAGADPHHRDREGSTALAIAEEKDSPAVSELAAAMAIAEDERPS